MAFICLILCYTHLVKLMYIYNIKNKETINLYNIISKHISERYDSKIG